MVAPAALSHVVLNTKRYEAMREWYLKVLQARIVLDIGSAAFLTFDHEHHRLALVDTTSAQPGDARAAGAGAPPVEESLAFDLKEGWTPEEVFAVLAGPEVGLSHTAYTYGSLAELLDTYERLKNEGIKPVLSVNHGPTTSFYYRDPDQHMIELQIDNFAEPEEATAFMSSDVFVGTRGVGWPFDADDLLADHRSGRPLDHLLEPWAN